MHEELRMASLIIGTNGGATLSVLIPHRKSLATCPGCAASSPRTERGMSGPSSFTNCSSLKMISALSLKYRSTAALSRSAANTYCGFGRIQLDTIRPDVEKMSINTEGCWTSLDVLGRGSGGGGES